MAYIERTFKIRSDIADEVVEMMQELHPIPDVVVGEDPLGGPITEPLCTPNQWPMKYITMMMKDKLLMYRTEKQGESATIDGDEFDDE